MRILIVDTAYSAFLTSVYATQPDLAARPYEEQWKLLMDAFFGTADSYSHFLAPFGHEATEVVVNCAPLQAAWAREHGLRPRSRVAIPRVTDELGRVLLAQADAFAADVVYCQSLSVLSARTLDRLRRRGVLLVGQVATELPPERSLRRFDLIVTALPQFVERLGARGHDVELLRLAFDPRVLERLHPVELQHDVVFAGQLAGAQWRTATPILEAAAERLPIAFYGFKAQELPATSAIRRSYHGEAWGLDFYRVLASARIALNRHGDVAEGHAANMRLYEATGVGTFLLTDERVDLAELFEPGREVVTYASADELVEQAHYYLGHVEERARIARAGQERTLRDHTWESRMAQLADILGRRL
jgi:spore maturation protein CgeB